MKTKRSERVVEILEELIETGRNETETASNPGQGISLSYIMSLDFNDSDEAIRRHLENRRLGNDPSGIYINKEALKQLPEAVEKLQTLHRARLYLYDGGEPGNFEKILENYKKADPVGIFD